MCKQEVIICLNCDRYHKYCPDCRTQSRRYSNKKSNEKYRRSQKGKRIRALCEKNRRAKCQKKQENSNSLKIVGETSTKTPQDLSKHEMEAISAPEKTKSMSEEGANHVFFNQSEALRGGELGFSSVGGGVKKIFCSYCCKQCSNYTYSQILSNETYKKRYRKLQGKYKVDLGRI